MFSSSVMANSTLWVDDNVKIPMRADASFTNGNILLSIPIKSKVRVIKTNSTGWTQVEFDNQIGWMVSRYLSESPFINHEADKLSDQLALITSNLSVQKESIYKADALLQSKEDEIALLNNQIVESQEGILKTEVLQRKFDDSSKSNSILIEKLAKLRNQNESLYGVDILTFYSTLALILGLIVGVLINRASVQKVHRMYSI